MPQTNSYLISRKIVNSIRSQHIENAGRNLFYSGTNPVLPWTKLTRQLLTAHADEILALHAAGDTREVITYLTAQAKLSFCNSNQYIDISATHSAALEEVYTLLMQDIMAALDNRKMDVDQLSVRHSERLRQWLLFTNPFTQGLYDNTASTVKMVVCAEYAATLQMKVLHMDIGQLKEPVLDIGCGPHAHMVQYLRQLGVKAYGVDRFIASPAAYLKVGDWLDFNLPGNYWGTIISNLSFSNHFLHHHQRNSADCQRYAGKYMEILHALDTGGSYHYAPALPMVEQYLSPEEFMIRHYPVNEEFSNSIITKLKATG